VRGPQDTHDKQAQAVERIGGIRIIVGNDVSYGGLSPSTVKEGLVRETVEQSGTCDRARQPSGVADGEGQDDAPHPEVTDGTVSPPGLGGRTTPEGERNGSMKATGERKERIDGVSVQTRIEA
jgi:hypothetical protein